MMAPNILPNFEGVSRIRQDEKRPRAFFCLSLSVFTVYVYEGRLQTSRILFPHIDRWELTAVDPLARLLPSCRGTTFLDHRNRQFVA